jgi:hypothetical protein
MAARNLNCDFGTGAVQFCGVGFPNATTAIHVFRALIRELERFDRARDEGVRSEVAYRLWSAAEEAPPSLERIAG